MKLIAALRKTEDKADRINAGDSRQCGSVGSRGGDELGLEAAARLSESCAQLDGIVVNIAAEVSATAT